jgi:hypothetical protein
LIPKSCGSLMKSGANSAVVDTILSQIEKKFTEVTTKKIYKGFSLLKSNLILMRQDTICDLRSCYWDQQVSSSKIYCPTILSRRMRSKTNIILQGKCISHEIDVLF